MKFKSCALASLVLLAPWSHAQAQAGKTPTVAAARECPADARFLSVDALKKTGFELPVFKRYCYTDKAGSHALLLGEKQDRPFPEEQLSSVVRASLYRVEGDNTLAQEWAIRDFAGKDEAGVNFRSRLIELTDIDGDGLVDPVLVYRFYNPDRADGIDNDDYVGRIKIVTFHKGIKATIHAITGHLDGERKTTANGAYFALPKAVQQHLVKKMSAMYDAGQFGFDNSYGYVPKKESGGR
ncbi:MULTISPECIES: M949_RS01915 family surface polysaccharide biosynthesis protein [unclassified Variovorax]|uniref:M949_RS01915 family surface polysaccharide biosynthesis protein n=1 Tax=unclassified Variovorax TaxID=663243 RepID=UPI003F453906